MSDGMSKGLVVITFNVGKGYSLADTESTLQHRILALARVLNAAIDDASARSQEIVILLQECRNFYLPCLLGELHGAMQLVPLRNKYDPDGRPVLYSSGLELIKHECKAMDKLERAGQLQQVDSDGGDSSDCEDEAPQPAAPPPAFVDVDEAEQPARERQRAPLTQTRTRTMTVAHFAFRSPNDGGRSGEIIIANVHVHPQGEQDNARINQHLRIQRHARRIVQAHGADGGRGLAVPFFIGGDFNEDHQDSLMDTIRVADRALPDALRADGRGGEPRSWHQICHSLWALACRSGRLGADGHGADGHGADGADGGGANRADARDGRHGWRRGSFHGWLDQRLNQERIIDWLLLAGSGRLSADCSPASWARGGVQQGAATPRAAGDCHVQLHCAQFWIPREWRPTVEVTDGNWLELWKKSLRASKLGLRFPGDHFPLRFRLSLHWAPEPSPDSEPEAKRARSGSHSAAPGPGPATESEGGSDDDGGAGSDTSEAPSDLSH
jgi:hypothetical protein